MSISTTLEKSDIKLQLAEARKTHLDAVSRCGQYAREIEGGTANLIEIGKFLQGDHTSEKADDELVSQLMELRRTVRTLRSENEQLVKAAAKAPATALATPQGVDPEVAKADAARVETIAALDQRITTLTSLLDGIERKLAQTDDVISSATERETRLLDERREKAGQAVERAVAIIEETSDRLSSEAATRLEAFEAAGARMVDEMAQGARAAAETAVASIQSIAKPTGDVEGQADGEGLEARLAHVEEMMDLLTSPDAAVAERVPGTEPSSDLEERVARIEQALESGAVAGQKPKASTWKRDENALTSYHPRWNEMKDMLIGAVRAEGRPLETSRMYSLIQEKGGETLVLDPKDVSNRLGSMGFARVVATEGKRRSLWWNPRDPIPSGYALR